MSATKIEWADESWNPVTGCAPVSEGCDHCYARKMATRLRGRYGYPEHEPFRVTLHPDRLDQPLHWRKPRRVFVVSMGDLFHDDVPFQFRDRVLGRCLLAAQHTYLVLTKRAGAMRSYFRMPSRIGMIQTAAFLDSDPGLSEPAEWYLRHPTVSDKILANNLWLLSTVENQDQAWRIGELLKCPAVVHGVSIEPMLGPVDIREYLQECGGGTFPIGIGRQGIGSSAWHQPALDWVICGGETGPGARPMNPEWPRGLRDQCVEAGVPFFYKRGSDGSRRLDGKEWNEFPEARP